jgi:cytochrome c oxidase subunit 4
MKHVATIKSLTAVWLGLLVLLACTTASSYLHLGIANTVINLGISAIKVGLIAVFFMHLRRSDAAVRLAAGGALLFLFFLAFLSFADLLTRHEQPAAWKAPVETSAPGGPY